MILVLAAVALFVFAHDGAKLLKKLERASMNDFEMFYEGARRTLAGEDVYGIGAWGYPYLPTYYVLTAPLALLPVRASAMAWHLVKCALLVGAFAALWRMLERVKLPAVELAMGLAAFGILRALDSDLQLGQSNVFVLAMLVATAWAFISHRDEIAGLTIALATLFKVTPGLFLVYFAWKRSWRVVCWAVIGIALFGGLAPVLVFGKTETARLYRVFGERLLAPQLSDAGGPSEADGFMPGQSLAPVVQRYILPVAVATDRTPDDVRRPINLVEVSPRTAGLVARGAQVAVVLLMLLATWPIAHELRASRRGLIELGLVATVMLLAAPYARKAHFVSLLPALAATAAWAIDRRDRRMIVALLFAAALPGLTAPDVLGKALSERVTAYGSFTLEALILVGASIAALRVERAAERVRSAPAAKPERDISVFFPAYNEGKNIGEQVERALAVLPRIARKFEVIVVDDGSKDDTAAVVDAIAARHPEVRRITHPVNRGYGGAVKTGLAAAQYELVFYTDSDGQFDIGELPAFMQPYLDGQADVVIGYRAHRQDPFMRLVNAYCWGALVRTLFGISSRDIDCAFKLIPLEAVRRLDMRCESALVSTEILAKLRVMDYRVVERPVTHFPRLRGTPTGANLRVILRAFGELFGFRRALYRWRPAPPSSGSPVSPSPASQAEIARAAT